MKVNSSLEGTSIVSPHRMCSGVDPLLRGNLKMKMTMKSQMMAMVCFRELLLMIVLLFLKKQAATDSCKPFHQKAEKVTLPTKQVKDG